MIILRDQLFSSYSEVPIEGYSYYPSQVLTNYALDPLEKSADWVENTTVGNLKPVKKKTRLIKKVTASLKSLVKRKDKNNN